MLPTHGSALALALGLLLFYAETSDLETFLQRIIDKYDLRKESENISLIYANKKILRMYWNQLTQVYHEFNEYKFNYHDFWNIDHAIKHDHTMEYDQ
jgi:hypothetical protein